MRFQLDVGWVAATSRLSWGWGLASQAHCSGLLLALATAKYLTPFRRTFLQAWVSPWHGSWQPPDWGSKRGRHCNVSCDLDSEVTHCHFASPIQGGRRCHKGLAMQLLHPLCWKQCQHIKRTQQIFLNNEDILSLRFIKIDYFAAFFSMQYTTLLMKNENYL